MSLSNLFIDDNINILIYLLYVSNSQFQDALCAVTSNFYYFIFKNPFCTK